jgi:hypothetical protein
MALVITDLESTKDDLVVSNGGGSQSHYPIFADKQGVEYVSLNGHNFTKLATISNLKIIRRETVIRK